MIGIDVSHWQSIIDWDNVKKDGIEFAIIKAGGSDAGFYKDSKFEENYKGAKEVGIYVGAYYFVGSSFLSKEDGIADAKRFVDLIKGKTFEFPLVLDLETTSPKDKDKATEASIAFLDYLRNAGYYPMIYASDIGGFHDKLDITKLEFYDKWVARYGSFPKYVPAESVKIWQKTSTGNVYGIIGNVDMDECYVDYPSIIKRNGLNGFERNQNGSDVSTKSIDELAREVIKGVYGNGEDRKKALGSRYTDVQKKVNEILSNKDDGYSEKSIDELAKEVIKGVYGNGEDRKKALGDRYSEVQKRVNEILAKK